MQGFKFNQSIIGIAINIFTAEWIWIIEFPEIKRQLTLLFLIILKISSFYC